MLQKKAIRSNSANYNKTNNKAIRNLSQNAIHSSGETRETTKIEIKNHKSTKF